MKISCHFQGTVEILLFAYWLFFHVLSIPDFFQIQFFRKILSGLALCHTVWKQVWVQIVCKCYQQTTLVGKELMATMNYFKWDYENLFKIGVVRANES